MGKKNKDKKGKGKEKTEQKTEKNAAKRAKKELAEKGEDDIEQMIAEFAKKDKQLTQVIEEKCPPPSPRCNMTLVANADKDELIMFGGEYYTGKQMFLYNDLFFYSIRKNEWLKVSSPNPPPPRSSHQAVTLAQAGGQMWLFGGEYSSHTQNQFYHYRDLWLLHLKSKQWEQIKTTGKPGPSARSGHRMAAFRHYLIVFGGFQDNNRDYKYFNDLWAFDLDLYIWSQLEPSGLAPCPRSGCVLLPSLTGSRLVLYGGYSMERVKKDVDQGTIHADMFALQPEGKDEASKPVKWRWLPMKQTGIRPSPRSSMSAVLLPGNHGVIFGGVQDEEEDEEQLEGTFFNDMFTLDLNKGQWFSVQLRGSHQNAEKKRRRKVKQGTQPGEEEVMDIDGDNTDVGIAEDNLDGDSTDMGIVEDNLDNDGTDVGITEENVADNSTDVGIAEDHLENLVVSDIQPEDSSPSTEEVSVELMETVSSEEDVFTVTYGAQSSDTLQKQAASVTDKIFVPSCRMKPCLAVKNGQLYLYGGVYEDGDKQVTLSDFYSLDLSKLDVWKTIIAQDTQLQSWQDSDTDDEDTDESGRKRKQKAVSREAKEDADSDDDEEEELTFEDAPAPEAEECLDDYFERTQDYWLKQAGDIMDSEGIKLSDRKLLKFAKEICQEASFNA